MNDEAKQEVVERTATQNDSSTALIAMVERASTNPDVDVEKLERMWAMYDAERKRQAEQEFNRAMNRAQARIRRIAADAENSQTRSRYATYQQLDRALRPIYSEDGFSLSFDTGDPPAELTVRVVCYVSHEAGHTRTYHADIPADGKGAKGGDVMTKTHATGSAMSYGMRYLLKMIFNVAIGENDDDGNSAGAAKITEAQVTDIEQRVEALVESGKMPSSKPFFDWLKSTIKADSIEDITEKAHPDVIAMIERKEKQKASKKKAAKAGEE